MSRAGDDRALLRMAGHLASFGGWAYDVTTGELSWSDEIFAILEHPVDRQPQADAVFEMYTPASRDRLTSAWRSCTTLGTPFDLDVEVVTLGGRRLPARVVAEAQRDGEGRIQRIVGAFQDTSELTAARRSADELRRLLDGTTDGIVAFDRARRVTYVNDRAAALLRTPGSELVGRDADEVLPTSDRVLGDVLRAVEEGDDRPIEVEVPALEATLQIRALTSTRGVAVFLRDVTEQRHAWRELHVRDREIERQAALLDEARDAIIVRDLDHRVTFWNRRATELYGWSAEEVLGRSTLELFYSDRAVFDDAMAALLRDGSWHGELEHRTRDGRTVLLDARWSLLRGEDGEPYAVLVISTDVTERRRLEQRLAQGRRLESVGTLAGGLAHDLNNVLAPVLMGIELLREGEDDPSRRQLLASIERSAQRGTDIVSQLLTFASGGNGRRVAVRPAELVEEVADIARRTFPADVQLEVELPDDVWEVQGDPTQLHRVLLNLLINARDAMPDGGRLDLAVRNVELGGTHPSGQVPTGRCVLVEVRDEGVGMDEATADRIFEPFFTTKAAGEGTGLGLATSMSIVTGHGGSFDVDTQPGVGTRFTVRLPASPA